jgi:hypothetical protein
VVSVGEVSVVVVVVVGEVSVVLGRVSTLVRGTHVYSGSGMKPGGTTCAVSGTAGAWGGGWYVLCTQEITKNATIRPAVEVRIRPLMM